MVRLLDDVDHIPVGLRFVATVGVFDGVHLGHVHVLEALHALADERGAVPVAITFEPHPQAVITGRTPELICDPNEKVARMGEAGAEVVVVQRFDEAFRSQTAEEFLGRLGRGRDLAGLVMSPESAFGRDRQGTVDTVRRLAARDGWRLVEIDTVEIDGARVSSGRIRELVAAGDLQGAERLLGRRYALSGVAVRDGDGWWRLELGAPFTMPPVGSYAIEASWQAPRQVGDDPQATATIEAGLAIVDGYGVARLALGDGADVPGTSRFRAELMGRMAD
jgi:riboflavin kinase / FMN adenylyltransferase